MRMKLKMNNESMKKKKERQNYKHKISYIKKRQTHLTECEQ